ncbi:NAD(P)H-quinone oxidoreductase subunit I, chloroplastic [Methanobrevibacter cuticularis]|uniref:NAD(P)H-quinone oxidoreductase subunit I, chloroplastic n=1 Tax=Methanobrevibacter cuticularis TaxID=47311 RepID=A0A166ED44_9EURY|nr:DUF362 domain-containing protein [Methanobrevibacter cuticularis]KZX16524.1 NAD(P)H-quinone oxidoreductase subunit I, chloroplastic [Methanobrevibacter cuticularis]
MTSNVYFSNLRARSDDNNKGNKLVKLFKKAKFNELFDEKDLIGLKIHFGERGNDSYISPTLIRYVVDEIKKTGANPFLTDTNTLYHGMRHDSVNHFITAILNGFSYSVVEAPIIIADGLSSENEVLVDINQKHVKSAKIAGDIINADGLLVASHFKGHGLSGFGGAVKNLAMGCATIAGKLEQHECAKPIMTEDCINCGVCFKVCPVDAIAKEYVEVKQDYEYSIVYDKCIACMNCWDGCPEESIDLDWEKEIPEFIERMAEYALASVKGKSKKVGYINFLTNITPDCDCVPWSDAPIVPDIGFLASSDPVAIDAASVHLINQQKGNSDSMLHKNCGHGEDKFQGVWENVDGTQLLRYSEKIGLGSQDFRLIEI